MKTEIISIDYHEMALIIEALRFNERKKDYQNKREKLLSKIERGINCKVRVPILDMEELV